MSFELGVPKGLHMVLEERGVNNKRMSGDEIREILRKIPDFSDGKSRVERLLLEKKHIPYMLPKFHSELNPVERVWAQAKQYTRAYYKYTLPALCSTINPEHFQ